MADELGRLILARKVRSSVTVVIAEGETDYLTWATRAEEDVAVFGIVSGSRTKTVADCVSDQSTVVICTDNDAAGEKYAGQVVETLGARCTLHRRCPQETA